MVDMEILLVFQEGVQETLEALEETTSLEEALRCLRSISHSSKLVDLTILSEMTNEFSKSFQLSNELNRLEIHNFALEANSIIQKAVERAALVKPKVVKPKVAWWKFWS